MHSESYQSLTSDVKPLLLSAWSVTTTLSDWAKFPADLQLRTADAALQLPYRDTTRSRWESARCAKSYRKSSK